MASGGSLCAVRQAACRCAYCLCSSAPRVAAWVKLVAEEVAAAEAAEAAVPCAAWRRRSAPCWWRTWWQRVQAGSRQRTRPICKPPSALTLNCAHLTPPPNLVPSHLPPHSTLARGGAQGERAAGSAPPLQPCPITPPHTATLRHHTATTPPQPASSWAPAFDQDAHAVGRGVAARASPPCRAHRRRACCTLQCSVATAGRGGARSACAAAALAAAGRGGSRDRWRERRR